MKNVVVAIALGTSLAGCTVAVGPSDETARGHQAQDNFATADHTAFPAMSSHAGNILATPELVTVTFADYEFQSDVAAFGDFIPTSQWLATVGPEYGVTSATHDGAFVLPDAAPKAIKVKALEKLLDMRIQDGTLPPVTANTIYLVYTPKGTTVDGRKNDLGKSCDGFLGYHSDVKGQSGHFVYAVVGECSGDLGEIESTSAHEIIEAATDPFQDGYQMDLPASDPWSGVAGEVADLCDGYPTYQEGNFTLQRVWSAAAAAAGTAPCLPLPDANAVYVNVSAQPAKVITLKAGKSTTFTLTGWSTSATSDWTLGLASADDSAFDLQGTLSATTINNGGTVTLTVTVPAGTTKDQIGVLNVISGNDAGAVWPITIKAR